ncbi:hypothetical protein DSO57_1037073 [Entomophthora muscae]|uniref:Uncharacterized protein n=1 Tax=Entomophthora muscae TaxID=34485 RepID=A0ACC2S102_9FUNG|nr:hypothetical protein DSO57_1037073 [Entomophthora muscae]
MYNTIKFSFKSYIARESCHTEILNFAECSKGRTFSVIWSCREFSEEQKLQYLKEHP